MDDSRRTFLKRAGYLALGAGCSAPLLGAAARVIEQGHPPGSPAGKQLALVIDLKKCQPEKVRRACSEACHREHNVPQIPQATEEVKWLWTVSYERAFPDQVHAHMPDAQMQHPVLVVCNHCTEPPCTKVCPTMATWKRALDGIVMMDMHRCIGCRYCIAACPYGSRSFNWRDPRPHIQGQIRSEFPTRTKGVVEKCNFCAERLRDGLEPACVEAAREATGAKTVDEEPLTWGDVSDPDSPVSKKLRQNRTICRRVGLGTGPNVYYIV